MASSIVGSNAVVFSTSTGSSPVTASVTWSLGSGSNRAVAVIFSHEQTDAGFIASSVSVGGVSFTKIVNHAYGTTGSYAHAEIWACNDASAASIGANPTISIGITTDTTPLAAQGVLVTLQDANQTLASWTNTDTDGQLATSALSGDLTGFTTGSLVLGSYCDQTGGVSVNCAQTGGDATTEFTSSDVNFNGANARAVQFYAAAADTTPAIRVQRNTTSGSVYQSLVIAGVPDAASGPTISSLGDSTPNYQGSTTITGTGFPTSQTGSAAAHLGGVAQTVTWNTSTSCSIASIARSTLAYGNYNLTVTDAAGNTSANYATSLSPQAGWKYITTSGTLADPSLRLTTTPVDIVSGNQISVGNVVGGTIDDITLYVDGSYSCAASVISFDYEVHDGTEWGAVGTEYPNSANGKRGLSRNLARTLYGSLNQDLSQ